LKGFADLAGAFIAFVLLAIVLGTGGVTTATVAIGGVVVLTALLATALVREPGGSGRPALTANRLNLRAAFGLDRAAHREFVAVVAARFLFLFGTFAVGRFFLLIVADRLALEPAAAGREAATILAILALVTAVAALPAGLLTDRIGRVSMMAIGGLVTSAGVLLLLVASSSLEFVVYGSLMAAGTAMFVTANWAMTTDLVPRGEAARFMGIANFGTAGAAAGAGLIGPFADAIRTQAPELGYDGVLLAAIGAIVLSLLAIRPLVVHDVPATVAAERTAS
jgi:MFS family permease